METQYISLNMTPTGVNPCFHISQYDVGRMLGFIVHSGGATVDLDTYTCTIEATRSDGTAITSAVATTDNIGTFEVTPTMSNKTDKYRCQLVIVDANSKRIASLPFDMDVCKAAMDENSESIEEDASLYQQYTKAVQGAIAEANADIQAEENARIAAVTNEKNERIAAVTNEKNERIAAVNAEATARQTADNTLQGNINSEAATRASADSNLQSQINQIIAPSGEAPSVAEVENARIGSDGTVYSTLGDAIRTQNSLLKSHLDDVKKDLSSTNELNRVPVRANFINGKLSGSGIYSSDTRRIATQGFIYVGDAPSLHYEVTEGYRVQFAFYNNASESSYVATRYWFTETADIAVEGDYLRLSYASLDDATNLTPSDSNKVLVSKNYKLYSTVVENATNLESLGDLYYKHNFDVTASLVNMFFPLVANNDSFKIDWTGADYINVAFLDANGANLGTSTRVEANSSATKIATGDVATLKVYAHSTGVLTLYKTNSLYEELINDLNDVGYYREITQADMTDGVLIQSNGVIASNENYVSIRDIPVIPSQKLRMTAYFGGGATNSGGVSGWDANGNFKQRVFDGVINGNPTTDKTQYVDKVFTIPDGVFYVAFASRKDGAYPIKLELEYVKDSPKVAQSAVEMHKQLEGEFQAGTIFDSEVKASIESVQSVLATSNKPMLTFAVFTDLHHDLKYVNDPTMDMMANINTIYDRLHFDGLMNLGDAIDGQFQTQYQAETCLSQVVTDMYTITTDRSHNLCGNHDDNIQSTWDNRGGQPATERLTLLEINDMLFKGSKNEIHNPNHITDYYVDYDEYNIRMICLGINYTSYVSATQTWLENTALQTDKDVIVFSHCATKAKWGYKNDISNGAYIETPLNDFVANGGTVIAYIHGHTHGDMIETDSDISFTEVAIGCAKFETLTEGTTGITYQPRDADDYTKILFDLICVDQTNRKIHFIRCGAGSDREVSY